MISGRKSIFRQSTISSRLNKDFHYGARGSLHGGVGFHIFQETVRSSKCPSGLDARIMLIQETFERIQKPVVTDAA